MKNSQNFSIRSTATAIKKHFRTEEEAVDSARNLCLQTGSEVSVVLHQGDTTRLIRKFYPKG